MYDDHESGLFVPYEGCQLPEPKDTAEDAKKVSKKRKFGTILLTGALAIGGGTCFAAGQSGYPVNFVNGKEEVDYSGQPPVYNDGQAVPYDHQPDMGHSGQPPIDNKDYNSGKGFIQIKSEISGNGHFTSEIDGKNIKISSNCFSNDRHDDKGHKGDNKACQNDYDAYKPSAFHEPSLLRQKLNEINENDDGGTPSHYYNWADEAFVLSRNSHTWGEESTHLVKACAYYMKALQAYESSSGKLSGKKYEILLQQLNDMPRWLSKLEKETGRNIFDDWDLPELPDGYGYSFEFDPAKKEPIVWGVMRL